MADNLSGSGGSQFDQLDGDAQFNEGPSFNIYGMYFCSRCKDLLTPYKENGQKLQFICKSHPEKVVVDFTNARPDQCIIYNKQLKPGSKAAKASKQFAMDPTLPRIRIECPECSHEEAFYIVTPDEGETSIEVQLICANAVNGRCEKIWTLPPEEILFDFAIKDSDFQ